MEISFSVARAQSSRKVVEMPKYAIQQKVPGAGELMREQLREISTWTEMTAPNRKFLVGLCALAMAFVPTTLPARSYRSSLSLSFHRTQIST